MERSKLKRLILFAGAFVVILLLLLCANMKRRGGKVTVQTEKAVKGRIVASVSGSAKIQPEVQVKISAKVSGQILRIGVLEGERVKRNQFLVQLDSEVYKAAVEQSESSVKGAHANHERAKNDYDRVRKLFDSNLASASELEIAKSTFKQAEAQVEQAEAMLKQAKDDLSKTTIYSPMDGVVSQVNKKVGEMAMGSQFTLDVIMVVADLSKMLAETDIDENDVVSIALGDSAKISVDAYPDTVFRGVVKEIANTGTTTGTGTQEEVTNFLVKVAMIEKPETIRPSMSATVDIVTESKDSVITVPIQCVTARPPLKPKPDPKAAAKARAERKKAEAAAKKNKGTKADSALKAETPPPAPSRPADTKDEKPVRCVFVVKDGIARQVTVETGISSDTQIEIVKGLSEGDVVVSGSYRILSKQLKDGDKVSVSKAGKKPSGDGPQEEQG
ncbi:MAG: efflux RND transporter periplasmic adaptor subunit [bacterium]|nr:efflux RND transporter periplasmic adaptor subunit [bacterium]